MKSMRSVAPVAAVATLLAVPGQALAQATTPAVDLTPLSDAATEAVTSGITTLIGVAPIVITFAVVLGIIRKVRSLAK